jgi:polysaccharide deacetylase family protein (PEP-CTERM system associated)
MSAAPSAIVNAMTVDVEDYFQVSAFDDVVPRDQWTQRESRVVASTDRLLELFADAGVRATFFILGWVATKHPDLVRRIAAAGHEVASHGYGHRLVYDLTRQEFTEDVRRSRDVLAEITGRRILGYRAPSFSVTARSLWALDVLLEEGFVYDASIFPIHHDRYGIPTAPRHFHARELALGKLWECPSSTVRLGGTNLPVGGGGYFRLLPFAWTRWGMERINQREGQPAIFYLHPWEIDPGQPRLATSRVTAFRHYCNLHKTEERLTRLLRHFRFAPLADVLATAQGQPELAAVRAPVAVPASSAPAPQAHS